MAVNTEKTDNAEKDIDVEKDDHAEKAIAQTVQKLIDYAVLTDLIGWNDRIWSYNLVLDLIGAEGPAPDEAWVLAEKDSCGGHTGESADAFDLEDTLALLARAAVLNGKEEDTAAGRDRISMRIMGILMPKPSDIFRTFRALYEKNSPKAATDYFYRLSCDAGYVRREAIARNIQWTTPTKWKDLEITINLSKPEKDPREIAAAGAAAAAKTTGNAGVSGAAKTAGTAQCSGEKYPACQLCIENEGYSGRDASSAFGAHPARQNLRIIPIELGGERWGLQYSPYAYFTEHCIAMSAHHRLMHIDRSALECLFDFVDFLPHYFVGSNADLPIVGGSILSHDHFQGGAHEFPLMKADVSETFGFHKYPDVKGEILTWPLSVVRLTSSNKKALLDASDHTIATWRAYSDASVGIIAHSANGTPHNTVTPVVRRVDLHYEAYLILRCNITSDEHPLGVFHPHAEYHHIKKENIGLIEAMGLAILPPRLAKELNAVGKALLSAVETNDEEALNAALLATPETISHAPWALELFRRRKQDIAQSPGHIEEILHDEVGKVFGHVLEDAGVFKWDTAGREGQRRFIEVLLTS